MILAEYDAKKLLEEAKVPVVPAGTVQSIEEANEMARSWGYPLVLKLSSALHSHKTEIGGVILNIRDAEELASAYSGLSALRRKLDPQASVILEPMAPAGVELFVGAQRHAAFGLVLSVGLGGVQLELFQDVSFRLLPARSSDFREMLEELKCWSKLRKGFRNLPPLREETLTAFLSTVADFAMASPGLQEMDLNPVMAYADRAVAVDARIVLGD